MFDLNLITFDLFYKNNLLRMRMQVQDERWKALGVNKEELKQLNSPEDQKKIHDFKKGVN